MNLQSLLENAHLDALGLLDQQELAEYNAAFAAAPPAIQAQVRAEQARWANLDFLLPRVEPPADLRARVLDAVSAEILKSLAGGDGSDVYTLRQSRRVSPAWRAATIGLLGVAAVLSAAFVNLLTLNASMQPNISDVTAPRPILSALDADQDRLNDVLFNPGTKLSFFKPVVAGSEGAASIRTNPDWKTATLNVQKLSAVAGKVYYLAIVDESGNLLPGHGAVELKESLRNRQSFKIDSTKLVSGMRLAIISVAKGAEIATGTIVLDTHLG